MINKSALDDNEKLFFEALADSGFPADDAAFRVEMQTIADDAALEIANPGKYSAFWVFVRSAVAEPLRHIIRYLVTQAVPGFYVKTATGTRLDYLAWAHGVERKAAVKMRCTLTLHRAAGAGGEVRIPAGSRIRSSAVKGVFYRVITLADVVIPYGVESTTAECEAEAAGSSFNLAGDYYQFWDSDLQNVGAITAEDGYINRVGADEESDADLRLRIRDRFAAAGEWHIDAKYRGMISSRAGVSPERVYFKHYEGGADNPHDADLRGPGSANAYIIFDGGATSPSTIEAINEYITLEGNHGHGDSVIAFDFPRTVIDLEATVLLATRLDAEERAGLIADIRDMMICALWGNDAYTVTHAWPYSVFSFSKLAGELHEAFPDLLTINFSRGDIDAALELPFAGDITVREA